MSGSFCSSGNTGRLYFSRKDIGRGIRGIKTMYESRATSIRQHLRKTRVEFIKAYTSQKIQKLSVLVTSY